MTGKFFLDGPAVFEGRPDWMERGSCRDLPVSIFYPASADSIATPKSICASCPVAVDCLEHALHNNEAYGVWGGKSERERRAIRRRRAGREGSKGPLPTPPPFGPL